MGSSNNNSNSDNNSNSSNTLRERKRRRIRRHLQQCSHQSRDFHKRYADFIRALRYMRFRSEEVAFIQNIIRLRMCRMTNGVHDECQSDATRGRDAVVRGRNHSRNNSASSNRRRTTATARTTTRSQREHRRRRTRTNKDA
uniref:Uncharacterized protein n=1 Tax=Craspedostauros australis TaxID=1486917 RepID=A0A7R9WUE2_9STRA|mmetsp:Transcript_18042/g.50044  ORF Transcript_18042/g.50044 Transcript_18042/m.50044 type:complete len:141 (+) Transcript_18042:466-888(+)